MVVNENEYNEYDVNAYDVVVVGGGTLFLHTVDTLTDEDLRRLAAAGIPVVPGEVAGLVVEDGRLTGLRMTDGRVFDRSVVFVGPRFTARDDLLTGLGAGTSETPFGPYVTVDATGRTSVPGVWAAGNAVGPTEQVVNAASAGYRAGLTVNSELVFADLDRKAADRGAGAPPRTPYDLLGVPPRPQGVGGVSSIAGRA